MKRARLGPGAKSLQRGSTFKPRTTAVKTGRPRSAKRAAAFYRPEKTAFQAVAAAQLACMNPRCLMPDAPWNAHHVVYAQHIRLEGGDEWDPRNAMRLCCGCHDRYHARSLRLPADVLPPAAVEFTRELLGERASDYLARYYPAA